MIEFNIEFVRVCPYCMKRAKKRKATCGNMKCQYKHHLQIVRKYWDTHYRKTDRINKNRLPL